MITNVNVYGLNESIIASGYPMSTDTPGENQSITDADHKRVVKLGNADPGSGHDCFLKGIIVQFDLTVPQYIWMQFERYHFADIVSSQSKMHKILKMDVDEQCNEYVYPEVKQTLKILIDAYNNYDYYLEKFGADRVRPKNELFQAVVSNCPMGYNLTARITTNYLQLKTIYNQRKNHKMEEWHEICNWMEDLPYFSELCLGNY